MAGRTGPFSGTNTALQRLLGQTASSGQQHVPGPTTPMITIGSFGHRSARLFGTGRSTVRSQHC